MRWTSKTIFLVLIISIFLLGCTPPEGETLTGLGEMSEEEFISYMGEQDRNIADQAKLRFSCEDAGEELTFGRGSWSRSIPKFFCSGREGGNQGERICRSSGHTSILTRCEYGCDRGTGRCVEVFETGNCCLDHQLEIGSFSTFSCGTDSEIELISLSEDRCRNEVLEREYRYASYYKTTSNFALVCTEPCSIGDQEFLDASFEGHVLGVDILRESTGGVLPKVKMEFHEGMDGDCFTEGYWAFDSGSGPSGYALPTGNHAILCNSGYWWYLNLTGTNDERDLEHYRNLESQVLTIHEPIHIIFSDYAPDDTSLPEYTVQESFCKGVSLVSTGTFSGYDDPFFAGWGEYSIVSPPPADDPAVYNFLVYSLHERFGFDEGEDTREFFQQYKDRGDISMNGNMKVKEILDEILSEDTTASFDDVGVSLTAGVGVREVSS